MRPAPYDGRHETGAMRQRAGTGRRDWAPGLGAGTGRRDWATGLGAGTGRRDWATEQALRDWATGLGDGTGAPRRSRACLRHGVPVSEITAGATGHQIYFSVTQSFKILSCRE
jgi:hypothetical protein